MTNLFSMMAELMRPPTEEEAAMMMSMMEELMKPPTEEEMAEMEQGKDAQTNIILRLSYTYQLVSSWFLAFICGRKKFWDINH